MACMRLTDLFRDVMQRRGAAVFNYVDDTVGCGRGPDVHEDCEFLLNLLSRLGFPISTSKLVRPTTSCVCLGIVVNTKDKTLSVTEDKLHEILDKCQKVCNQTHISRRQLQSVLGSLMFLHKAVKPTRFFVNRLLYDLRSSGERICVTENMCRDLQWFLKFVPIFNGTTTYDHVDIEHCETLAIDSCLTGMGGVWGSKVYRVNIPETLQKQEHLNIVHFELLNILVAFKVWGEDWRGGRIVIKTDNRAVVDICNSGFTRDLTLAAYIRNIWMYTASLDVELIVTHIPGKCNQISDLLSRWDKITNPNCLLRGLISNPIWSQVSDTVFDIDWEI